MKYVIHIDEMTRNGVSLSCLSFINHLVNYADSVDLYIYGSYDTQLTIDTRIKVTHKTSFDLISRARNVISFFSKSKTDTIIDNNRVDIAYSFLNLGMKRQFFKSTGYKVGVVHGDIAHGIHHYTKGIAKYIFRQNLRFLSGYNKVVALTQESIAPIIQLTHTNINNVVVIHNIFDYNQDTFYKPHSVLKSTQKIKLVYVGRLESCKGLNIFVDIVERLILQYDVVFTIVGNGIYEKQLKQQVTDHNLSRNFEFVGFQSNPEQYFLNSDFFVFPSESEGWPTVIMESLAAQCCVLASDIPGNRAILTYDEKVYGYLLPPHAIAFADAIVEHIKKPCTFDIFDFNSFNQSQISAWLSLFKYEEG